MTTRSRIELILDALSIEELQGCQTVLVGDILRITVPALTEETRKGFCKDVDKMAEEAKVHVRNARRDVNDEIKKDKTIPEDLSKSYLEDVQKATDKAVEKIEEIAKAKQKEIMTI